MGRKPCCAKEGLNRGAWTAVEDKSLTDYIQVHGAANWRNLPQRAGLKRCGKSCRLRWINYLRPDIKRGNITDDEAELITRLHKLLGNRWSLIAGRLPGRTDNEIKNYWNTTLGKKLHTGGGQSSLRKVDQHKENPNQPKMNNSLAIRTKPTRLRRSQPFIAPAPSSVAAEGGSNSTGERTRLPGLEPSEFMMNDFEIDEKFFLEVFNMEFEGPQNHDQHCSPCINEQMGHSSSSPDSGDNSTGNLFSDQMMHEYSAALVELESDWLQDYVANPY